MSLMCNSSACHSHHNASTANNAPRFIARKKLHPNDSVSLTLVGGNAVGIFVRDVMPGSLLAGVNGVHCGDQILQVLLCYLCLCGSTEGSMSESCLLKVHSATLLHNFP